MAFSVEGRLPFLDYRVVEFAFSLPSSFKIRGGYTKRVLRESMRGILPEKVRQRVSKLGFATPERAWQRTVLRPKIEDALCDPRLSAFIVPDRARDYLRIIDKSGQTDFMPWLWTNLSLWMKVHDLEP
jgi:asparagine synthase (glutamine-hydrolysing)